MTHCLSLSLSRNGMGGRKYVESRLHSKFQVPSCSLKRLGCTDRDAVSSRLVHVVQTHMKILLLALAAAAGEARCTRYQSI